MSCGVMARFLQQRERPKGEAAEGGSTRRQKVVDGKLGGI